MSDAAQAQAALLTAGQVAAATGGELVQGAAATAVCAVTSDSRAVEPEALFVALRGERFDGARFCAAAAGAGASAVLVERAGWEAGLCAELPPAVAVVAVADSLRALGDLAAWHRRRFSAHVIGVTGSNGKTSTKEMIAAVLGGAPAVLHNRGNFNNLIGMPRSLLELGPQHRWVVLEMGMNVPGEIARLAEVAAPEWGVLTNVHQVHLEGLGSLQAVAAAKGELLEALPAGGAAVLNADDPLVLQQARRTRARQLTFGQSPAADVRVERMEPTPRGLAIGLRLAGGAVQFELERIGAHNAMNAAAAAAVGQLAGLDAARIAERLARAPAPPMRMEVKRLGDLSLLVDCYNANPRSVQIALDSLGRLPASGPRLAVLGDMAELGAAAEQLHRQVGRVAAEVGIDGLCTIGPLAAHIAAEARRAGLAAVEQAADLEGVLDWVERQRAPGGWLLIKGSRRMRLERLVTALVAPGAPERAGAGEP